MKTRLVILSVDDICNIFKDYAHMTGFPQDAQCDTLLFNKQLNKMCLRITAPSLGVGEPPEEIRFDLKRTHII